MTDEGLCASGKMGLCIKCPDCMSTTTKFKLGDMVRHKGAPSIRGTVDRIWDDGTVDFVSVDNGPVAYPPSELELIDEAPGLVSVTLAGLEEMAKNRTDTVTLRRDQHDELVLAGLQSVDVEVHEAAAQGHRQRTPRCSRGIAQPHPRQVQPARAAHAEPGRGRPW